MLQFDTQRLLIGSVRGGILGQPNENFEGNLFFELRGIRLDNKILLRVEWVAEKSEIEKGHIFHDINELWELISNSNGTVRYPILSFHVEPRG